MKTKITLGLFAFAFLFSCQKEKPAENQDEIQIEQKIEKRLDVQTFSALPHLNQCTIYIAKNKSDFDAEKFLFADDYGNNAYINIDGNILQIPLEEGNFDPSESEREIKFENGTINISIEPLEQLENEEELIFQGEMSIQKDDKLFKTKIYGKSNC